MEGITYESKRNFLPAYISIKINALILMLKFIAFWQLTRMLIKTFFIHCMSNSTFKITVEVHCSASLAPSFSPVVIIQEEAVSIICITNECSEVIQVLVG